MRLLVGSVAGIQNVFAVEGGKAVNLSAAIPEIGNDLTVLIEDDRIMSKAAETAGSGEGVDVSDIVPALPIPGLPTIACLGLNYTDHIAMGTPPGVGHAKKPNPRWLNRGEVVEIEIEGIGLCASPVVDEGEYIGRAAAE